MLDNVRLQHYRSYEDTNFVFDPGVNIIVGPNASGKTNLLESILLLARGQSYRASDIDLIAFNQPWARLDGATNGSTRTLKLIRDGKDKKIFDIDGKLFRRLSLQRKLPIVLFEPNHLNLLSGSPEKRRVYLDDLLEQSEPGYGLLIRQYKRTLIQRNSLLKLGYEKAAGQIFPWNIRISELAGKIVRARYTLINKIEQILPALYTELSHSNKKVSITYVSQFSAEQYESHLLHKLESSLELDAIRGFTASGPHREDFDVTYDGVTAADIASRGEVRTAVLALKIIELKILETVSEQKPLLLLDDVFSELDAVRRGLLTAYITDYQTFITTTDADVLSDNLKDIQQKLHRL